MSIMPARLIMLTKMRLVFDEIGYWSEIKLDIVEQYALQYSRILSSRKNPEFYHIYIDAFAGSGKHISRTKGSSVRGSPQIALDINPPFREYFFIDINGDKVAELNRIVSGRPEAHVLEGDCNYRLITEIFPKVRFEDYRRGLCLLDPYGLDLNWEVIKVAGQMKSIDMFLNFPVMDMNRNVLWKDPAGVDHADVDRMNSFWGDESWNKVAYRPTRDLFGQTVGIKESNNTIASAFKKRLKEVAGFKYVSRPIPMRNSKGATIYYLFFASQQQVADNIITDIFNKYVKWGIV